MKLKEIISVMNMAQLDIASKTPGRNLYRAVPLDMFHLDSDKTYQAHKDAEVEEITNVCKLGVTIWII